LDDRDDRKKKRAGFATPLAKAKEATHWRKKRGENSFLAIHPHSFCWANALLRCKKKEREVEKRLKRLKENVGKEIQGGGL